MREKLNIFRLEWLNTFDVVATEGSMSGAADDLAMTASAVMQQIGKLEEYYSAELLVRHRDGATLNEAGRLFLPYARRTLETAAGMEKKLGRLGSRVEKLRIGYTRSQVGIVATAVNRILQRAEFKEKLKVFAEELVPHRVLQLLLRGELDVGVAPVTGNAPKGIASKLLSQSPLAVIAHKGHAVISRSKVSNISLQNTPLALLESGPVRKQIDQFFGRQKPQNVVLETNSRTMLLDLVRSQPYAATILDGITPDDELKSKELNAKVAQTTKILWRHKEQSEAVIALIEAMLSPLPKIA